MLQIDPKDAVPIWKQIEDGVRRMVATGRLAAGEPVPSVRELAGVLRVNPATVSKAYQRLTDARVLVVRRGEGTFVAEEAPVMRRSERREHLRESATKYAISAVGIGATEEEAQDELHAAFAKLGNGNGGNTR